MTEKKQENPFETIIQNFAYHDFQLEAVFEGIYSKTVVLKEETKDEKGEKINAIEAHVFYDMKEGEGVYISTSHSINKAVERAKNEYPGEIEGEQLIFRIEFLGKTEFKGKPFNQFNIGICTLQQYEAFNAPAKGKGK